MILLCPEADVLGVHMALSCQMTLTGILAGWPIEQVDFAANWPIAAKTYFNQRHVVRTGRHLSSNQIVHFETFQNCVGFSNGFCN